MIDIDETLTSFHLKSESIVINPMPSPEFVSFKRQTGEKSRYGKLLKELNVS